MLSPFGPYFGQERGMHEEQSTESARIRVADPTPGEIIDFSMVAIDHAGDRRYCVWVSAALGIPPGALLAVMHRTGLLRYDESWNRILVFDFSRNDYIPYTSQRNVSWWDRVWIDVAEWINQKYGSQ